MIFLIPPWCIVLSWTRIETEGAPERFFKSTAAVGMTDTPVVTGAEMDTSQIEIEGTISHAGNTAEGIAIVQNQGLMIDDNNEPAPENVSILGLVEVDNAGTWSWDGTCNRKLTGAVNHHPSISTLHGLIPETASYVTVFLLFCP